MTVRDYKTAPSGSPAVATDGQKASRRGPFLFALTAITLVVMAWQAAEVQVRQRDALLEYGEERYLRTSALPAMRGAILDRNRQPLSLSTPVRAVWIKPSKFREEKSAWPNVAKALDMPLSELTKKAESDRKFVYLRRQLPPELVETLMDMDVSGLYEIKENRRFYPQGEAAAHVVGFTDIDENGLEGVERAYQEWLTGIPGKVLGIRENKHGQRVTNLALMEPVKPGKDLVLSIDQRLQYLTYRALKAAVHRHQARAGSAVLLDPRTGEILAMASQKGYNPNNRSGTKPANWRNRAISDVFEPGSTIKPFTIAAGLEAGVIAKDTVIDCSKPIYLGRRRVRDVHPHGKLTVSDIIKVSSNVGTAQIALKTPPHVINRVLNDVGFGQISGLGLPGEASGYVPVPMEYQKIERATLGFGYGLNATTIQLASAYGVLANGGVAVTPTIIKVENPKEISGRRVLSEHTAKLVSQMMEGVTQRGGTASRAAIHGYSVAGKTGTAHKVVNGQYADDRYTSSFVGFAPASQPRLVLAIVIDEPTRDHYGGVVAAPAFREVMSNALSLLSVPPSMPMHASHQSGEKPWLPNG